MKEPRSWERAKRLLEAALFACGDVLDEKEIEKLTGLRGPAIDKAVAEINEELSEHPFKIEKIGEGWIMVLDREYEEKVHHLFPSSLISKSEMRTLALIASNEPISISEIVSVRGSSARDHVERLIKLGLIAESKEGRKRVFRTTKRFSQLFKVEPKENRGG